MTVITKTMGEKKPADQMKQPLVVEEKNSAGLLSKDDPEAGRSSQQKDIAGHYLILRRPSIGPNSITLYCLFFAALLGMSIGVIGGVYIYRLYASEQIHRFRTGWYSIPYDRVDNKLPLLSDQLAAGVSADSDLFKSLARDTEQEGLVLQKTVNTANSYRNFFQESFEIDLENEHYEDIDVPDFRGGRQGRFIHDFNINLTGIVDIDGHSCFVMPLNRDRVLPPRNMYDLLNKMYDGYYEVNTKVVRDTMKAVLPAIRDRSSVGTYISRECKHMPIYALEKINVTSSGIVKRSADGVLFGHFAGNHISEYDIVNIAELQQKME